ncbi:transposase [Streptomyces mirabilis]
MALAGRVGVRLAQVIGIAARRTTLLRSVVDLPDPAAAEHRAVGVDDYELRRGHVYGTVVIDAETHRVLDLLPERDAATLAPCLAAHRGIEVLCRDRSGAYADAAATAAPQALQVACRCHLCHHPGRSRSPSGRRLRRQHPAGTTNSWPNRQTHRPAVRPRSALARHGQGSQTPTPQQTGRVRPPSDTTPDRNGGEDDHPRCRLAQGSKTSAGLARPVPQVASLPCDKRDGHVE